MSRVAVAGASGLVGRALVRSLRNSGAEVVEISRSAGVDVGEAGALTASLDAVDALVDVLNTPELEPDRAVDFFKSTTGRLLAAEVEAGVRHHVVLSIVNVDSVSGNGHYAGKRAQERTVTEGPVDWTILRATQFFDFAAMVAGWTARDGVATLAPLLVQPVAVDDVAGELARLSLGDPQGRAREVAGAETHDFVDMARRTLAARGDETRIRASWRDGPFTTEMAGEVLLPAGRTLIGPTTFEEWLSQQSGQPGDGE